MPRSRSCRSARGVVAQTKAPRFLASDAAVRPTDVVPPRIKRRSPGSRRRDLNSEPQAMVSMCGRAPIVPRKVPFVGPESELPARRCIRRSCRRNRNPFRPRPSRRSRPARLRSQARLRPPRRPRFPRFRGSDTFGRCLCRASSSARLRPNAFTRMSTSPCRGVGTGRRSILKTSGPPASYITAVFVIFTTLIPSADALLSVTADQVLHAIRSVRAVRRVTGRMETRAEMRITHRDGRRPERGFSHVVFSVF